MTSKDVDNNPIVVSISCITYNHAPFIRQCLDGFMMQKTDFAFEVLIHDDASTDGTTEIIKEYEARCPDVIKPIYEEENQWVKGRRGSAVFNFPRARGKYIALCEGDDYWTDPLKLQKQVDFLDNNLEYSMCSHRFKVYNQSVNLWEDDWYGTLYEDLQYDLKSFLEFKSWVTQPLSVLFRREALPLNAIASVEFVRDLTLMYFLLKSGKGIMLNSVMGVYRKHSNGVWQGASFQEQRTSDFKVCLSIYNYEKTKESSMLLYNRMSQCSYLGPKYILYNLLTLFSASKVVAKYYGIGAIMRLWINFMNFKNK